ncbi:MAG TPA: RNase H family protein [Candidatus Sulfotelmatobacter sp.]|nr:RNase H family protein [Candidatus Sulfotelmatobacter sp.]
MNQSITTPSSAINISPDDANPILIYVDGAGCGPDGKGSGFAWIRPSSGEQHIEQIDGLTNNQAEYRALISALVALPNGSSVEILTDSQLMWSQVIGKYRVHHPELAELLLQVRTSIKQKSLNIDLKWVPRHRNLAGKPL